jgi:hypothetical protein
MWEWIYRNNINMARREYFAKELVDVSHRAAEAFSVASGQLGDIKVEKVRKRG